MATKKVDIITQAIINGLEQALKGMKQGTPEYESTLAALKAYGYDVREAGYTAQDKEATTAKDKGLKKQISDLKKERDLLVAQGKPTTDIDGKLSTLRGQLSTATSSSTSASTSASTSSKTSGASTSAATTAVTTKPATSAASTSSASTSKSTTSATAEKTKEVWVNHLREAFKNVGDPKAQAQIDALFKKASAKGSGYTQTTFMDELNNIQWWRDQQPSLQKYFLLTHDPSQTGTLAEKRAFQTSNITKIMAESGIEMTNVDPVTGKFIDNSNIVSGLVEKAIANNWDDNQLKHYLATNSSVHFTQGGLIQSKIDTIKDTARLYGITVDPVMLKDMQTSLLDPTNARNETWWTNELKNMAVNQYKPFAAAIQGGSSLYNATYNYRNQMANLLEVAPENITWKDLMGGVIDSKTGNARTESDFVAQVKQNPLWQRTSNAKETYMGMFNDLAREFGITG